MKQSVLASDRLLVREYKMLHRQNIMGEKIKYQERRLEAAESRKICGVSRVKSLIFDSMTKRSTALPTFSNTATFKGGQFVNNVMGCVSHDEKEKRFYTSFGSVHSGASLMIHCIHSEVLFIKLLIYTLFNLNIFLNLFYINAVNFQIAKVVEECTLKSVPLPEKWYIQIDGASDNTAKAVLASIEHLQIQGLADVIEIWRLHVGHTHEVQNYNFINMFYNILKT